MVEKWIKFRDVLKYHSNNHIIVIILSGWGNTKPGATSLYQKPCPVGVESGLEELNLGLAQREQPPPPSSPWSMTKKRLVPFRASGRHSQRKKHLPFHVLKEVGPGGLFDNSAKQRPAMSRIEISLPWDRKEETGLNYQLLTIFVNLVCVKIWKLLLSCLLFCIHTLVC